MLPKKRDITGKLYEALPPSVRVKLRGMDGIIFAAGSLPRIQIMHIAYRAKTRKPSPKYKV
jgi:hypothetical protein